jgi:hypothetical protein
LLRVPSVIVTSFHTPLSSIHIQSLSIIVIQYHITWTFCADHSGRAV